MNDQTKISVKGQIVIPSDVRRELEWAPGTVLDVVRTPDGVLLRQPPANRGIAVDEMLARMRKIVRYEGPPLSEADWQEGISRHVRAKWADRRKPARKRA